MTPTWPEPDRLDHLVDGGSPATPGEEDLAGILSQLRADRPVPPDTLRSRVGAIAAMAPERNRRFRRPSFHALAAGLAPVMAAAAIAVAVWPTSPPGETQGRAETPSIEQAAPNAAAPTPPAQAKAGPTNEPRAGAAARDASGSSAGATFAAPEAPSSTLSGPREPRRWPYVLSLAVGAALLASGALAGWRRRPPGARRTF